MDAVKEGRQLPVNWMGKFTAVGRMCIHAIGSSSQTVRIAVDPYQRGVYDWVVRFGKNVNLTSELRHADMSSLEAFVKWMRDNPNLQGQIEVVPPDQDALLVTPSARPATTEQFTVAAVNAVETGIDDIIYEFLRNPFQHRSENNVHCEAYSRLKSVADLARLHHLGSGQSVQILHREWPEKYAANRFGAFCLNEIWPLNAATHSAMPDVGRGKYDLAVLRPENVATCNDVSVYADGEIDPVIAVEFGLNERYEHLRGDVAKLNSNQVPHGYVVHLLRPDSEPDNFKATEKLVDLVSANNTVRAAYARVEITSGVTRYHYKYVRGGAVLSAESPPEPYSST